MVSHGDKPLRTFLRTAADLLRHRAFRHLLSFEPHPAQPLVSAYNNDDYGYLCLRVSGEARREILITSGLPTIRIEILMAALSVISSMDAYACTPQIPSALTPRHNHTRLTLRIQPFNSVNTAV